MAEALARIHSLSIDAPTCDPWGADQIPPRAPAWSRRPDLWQEAARILAGPAPDAAAFIHGDYQHFNILWVRGTLTGIIDWTLAGIGHPDRDIGHSQLNLAVLFSAEWAKEFAAAYQAEMGRPSDGWWNLYEICLYNEHWLRTIPIQVGNRAPLDISGMNARVDDLLEAALQ
jgi:aminoglycoside phosphotransferase (APT) family kinase protein